MVKNSAKKIDQTCGMKNSLFVRHIDCISHKTLGPHDVDTRMRSKGLTANRILRVIFQSNRRVDDRSVNNSFESQTFESEQS